MATEERLDSTLNMRRTLAQGIGGQAELRASSNLGDLCERLGSGTNQAGKERAQQLTESHTIKIKVESCSQNVFHTCFTTKQVFLNDAAKQSDLRLTYAEGEVRGRRRPSVRTIPAV
jgi:hypothetical protein